MRDVYRQPHISEMKPVAQPNQRQGHNMMSDKLLIIPTGFFETKTEDQGLLSPVARLQQIVGFEQRFVSAVWESLVHAHGVEIPDRRAPHDIHAIGTKGTEIKGGIHLFHEAILF